MSCLRIYVMLGCTLAFSIGAAAESRTESLWRSVYDAELSCNSRDLRNALVRLLEFDQFCFVRLTAKQKVKLVARLSELGPFTPRTTESNDRVPSDGGVRSRWAKRASGRRDPVAEAGPVPIDTKSLRAQLLKRAESAYSFGRLEEAKRCYALALKIDASSTEAKKGLEKVAAEME